MAVWAQKDSLAGCLGCIISLLGDNLYVSKAAVVNSVKISVKSV